MPDEMDMAAELAQEHTDKCVSAARRSARSIPPGIPGKCEWCGEPSKRLVGKACAPCREENGLP